MGKLFITMSEIALAPPSHISLPISLFSISVFVFFCAHLGLVHAIG